MAVSSYMDFFGYRFADGSDKNGGTVEVDYRIKYDAPIVTATVAYKEREDGKYDYHINDLGRKHRASKAEQERVWELFRVTRNYLRMFLRNPEQNAKAFPRK